MLFARLEGRRCSQRRCSADGIPGTKQNHQDGHCNSHILCRMALPSWQVSQQRIHNLDSLHLLLGLKQSASICILARHLNVAACTWSPQQHMTLRLSLRLYIRREPWSRTEAAPCCRPSIQAAQMGKRETPNPGRLANGVVAGAAAKGNPGQETGQYLIYLTSLF